VRRREVLAGLLGLAGCSPGEAPRASDAIYLSVAGAYLVPVYEEINRAFEAANPDLRVIMNAPVEGWDEQIQRTILDAAAGQRPDVALQGFHRLGAAVEHGLASALDDPIAQETGWREGGYAQYASLGQLRGRQYGLPFRMATPVIYLNLDLAAAPPPILTWSDLSVLAASVTARTRAAIGVILEYTAEGNWTFIALIQSLGGRIESLSQPPSERDRPILQALQLLQQFGRAGTVDLSREQAIQAFSSGRLGIYVTTSAAYEGIVKRAGGRFRVAVRALPLATAGASVPVGGGALTIPTESAIRRRLAWRYLKFASGPQAQGILMRRIAATPANRLVLEEAGSARCVDANPALAAGVAQLPHLTSWYAFPGANSLKITRAIRERLRRVLLGREEPQHCLAAMRSEVQTLLAAV
jgi:multiple sugar transport system substrate-binding protein